MKVAVTGANGFVGRAVLARLAELGHEARALVRRPAGLRGEVVMGTLDGSAIAPEALGGADVVVHLAARTHVLDDTAADPAAAYRRVNVDGTRALLDAALAARVQRFVYMSSVKAAGEMSLPGEPLTAKSEPRPEDDYGITKLEAEHLVRQRCEAAGIAWTIIRPPLVFGPGVGANFERMISAVGSGFPLPLGSVRNRRSIIYVENLADATVAACRAEGAANQVLMLADQTLPLPELLRAIASAQGRRVRLFPVSPAFLRLAGRLTGKSGEVQRLCGSLEIDPKPAMALLDWAPRISFEEAIYATVRARSPNR